MKIKNKLVVRSIAIKEEEKNLCFNQRKKHQRLKWLTPMDFTEHFIKSGVSDNNKVCYGRFLQNGLLERYCYISKSRWDVEYLEVC